MRLLLFVLLLQVACFAETSTKISELTEVAAASVSSSDVIPLVNYPGTNTYKFKLSNLFSVPSLAAPSFTGIASFSNGTAAAPALTFTSDTDTGFYRVGANQLGITTGGALVGSVDSSGLWTLGASSGSQYHVANGQLLINGGNASDYTLKVVRGTAGVTNGAATVSIQDVTTNTTSKVAAIGLGRYDNSNKDNALIYAQNDATTATMSLGGGVSSLHAVTGINFYTAANSSTNIGNLVGSVSSGGLWTLGLSGGTQTHVANGQSLRLNYGTSGGDASLQVRHSSDTANSNALLYLETGGTSGGDPKVQYFVTGGQDWSHGIDNSDSDAWVLSNSATLGTNTYIKVPTSGIVELINGLRTKLVTTNVSSPPTDAELDSAFGTPSVVGSGFTGLVNDNGGGTAEYIVWSDGTNWFYVAGTKAL